MQDLTFDQKEELFQLGLKKVNKETDITWAEIDEKYGLDKECSRQYVKRRRKKEGYFKNTKQQNSNKQPITEKVNELYDNEVLDKLWIEKQKNRDLLSQIRKYERGLSRTELIKDYISEAMQNLTPLPCSNTELKLNMQEVMVLLLSDIHWGAKIIPGDINGINEYDIDIATDRLLKVKDYAIEIGKFHNINKLYIQFLGDLLENDIMFVMQKAIVEQPVIEQLITFTELLSNIINELANYFQVEIDFTPGNHGRNVNKRDESFRINNYEYWIFWYLKERLKHNENVKINMHFNYFIDREILGFNVLACHGEYDRDKNNSLNSYISMYKKFYDYLFVAHLHHQVEIDGNRNTEIIQNGSLSGANLYSVEKLKKGTFPSQKVLVFKRDYGIWSRYKLLFK